MKEEDRIWREGLRPLKTDLPDHDPRLPDRLLREFRGTHRPRVPARRMLWWGAGIAAAAAAVWMVVWVIRPAPAVAPKAIASATPNPASRPAGSPSVKPAEPNPARVRRRAVRRRKPASKPAAESLTAFYALPSAGMPLESGEVVRVSLPRSAMSVVGFAVSPERMFEPVLADVVVAEDGTARAIRFVQ